MKTPITPTLYKGYRFPSVIISHGVWWYVRFSLSFCDVEEIMAEHGIILIDETIRQWGLKFGQTYANALKRRRSRPGDKWHLDAVFFTIYGKRSDLWRSIDQHGNVLDILVHSRETCSNLLFLFSSQRFSRKMVPFHRYVDNAYLRPGECVNFEIAYKPRGCVASCTMVSWAESGETECVKGVQRTGSVRTAIWSYWFFCSCAA
ncbi:MAG TPA: hypothetical protein VHZ51_09395 [Ktedonobacteraceae bacterium]|nr:hypothetical protein [Ktedonobacteraceae bacterium]